LNYRLLLIVGIIVIAAIGVGAAYVMMRNSSIPLVVSQTTTLTSTSPAPGFYFLAFTQKGIAQVLNPFSQSQSFLGYKRVVNISLNVPQQIYYWDEVPPTPSLPHLFLPVNNGTVYVLNSETLSLNETIQVGSSMGFIGAAVSPNGEYAALADGPSGLVEVVQVGSLKVVWSHDFLSPTGRTYYPCDVRWTPDSAYLVIPMRFNNSVDLINASNGEVVKVRSTSLGSQPYMVSPDLKGKMVAVEFVGNNSVGFYSLPDLRLQGMVQMPKGLVPQHGVFTPNDQYYLEAPSNNDTVLVISTSNFQVIKEIPLPQISPAGLADMELTPDGQYAYVVMHGSPTSGGIVSLISISTLSLYSQLPLTTAPAIVIPIPSTTANYLVNQVLLPPVTGLHC
jgi:DNA-binding beta-propeller fold protein YncE